MEEWIMIRFNNDYNHTAHEKVLEAVMNTRSGSYGGYGEDEWCRKAADVIKDLIASPDAAVYFLPGATQANFIVCAAALRPIESVICADSGHIFCHEAGSVENTGHKLIALPGKDGKISAEQIAAEAAGYYEEGEMEYLTIPRMVYISFSTEWGTIYSKKEIQEISGVCRKYGMLLFVDGARMGYGLGAEENDMTLKDFAELTDVFYIGGTKCGAMFGEALVVVNQKLQKGFRSYMKQNGAVLAKGWLLGLQFYTLLQDDLYFQITGRADGLAVRIREAFKAKGIPMYVESPTNQQFVLLTDDQMRQLEKDYIFEFIMKTPDRLNCVRFCTGWNTTREEADCLIRSIEALN